MSDLDSLPSEQIPSSKKTKEWRKRHLDWATTKTFFNYSPVRKSVIHKKINYDLLDGKLHMQDLELLLNPEETKTNYIPGRIAHYPIMLSKLQVLRGEELARVFDFRVCITNPTAISEIEENKRNEILERLKKIVAGGQPFGAIPQQQPQQPQQPQMPQQPQDQQTQAMQGLQQSQQQQTQASQSQQQSQQVNEQLDRLNEYFTYQWQDMREIRANCLLNHYSKEYNFKLLYNTGFMDALTVAEEIYHCDIVGGEPVIERVNPLNIRILKSGYSNRVEDADIVILEDYWSPGKIIDRYYRSLSQADMKYIEKIPTFVGQGDTDSMAHDDPRLEFINQNMVDEDLSNQGFYFDPLNSFGGGSSTYSLMPYDLNGNVRVVRMYWKSRKRIKEVKSYDKETGEEEFNFYDESYKIDESKGEEETTFWINEAWEGTRIGEDIYVDMRPRPIQYNRLNDPSRCHFGFVGSIYNLNEARPYSLVDIMKQYNYLYDVIHDRLNKMMARNWGKLVRVDMAKIPKGWEFEKWMYFAKANGIAFEDSFKEGSIGTATGKLAGAMNNASSGVIDADFGNNIQQYINLLEYLKGEMSEVVGISKQREGQISASETVGGVERSNLQSNHITEWIFAVHDDVKRRATECFLETAKFAMRGRSKKFNYLLSDNSLQLVDIDGDQFAECDYGIVLDNSNMAQQLNQKIEELAQAALQGQQLSFSAIMKLYSSASLAEKMKMVENNEKQMSAQKNQMQQMQMQQMQQQAQMQQQQKMAELQTKEKIAQMESDSRIKAAKINAEGIVRANMDTVNAKLRMNTDSLQAETLQSMGGDGIEEPVDQSARNQLQERMRQFDQKMQFDREKEMNKVQMDQNKLVMEQEKLKAMLKNKPTNKK